MEKRKAGDSPVENKLEQIARIESVGTDMGTGGSFCTNCNYDLTSYLNNVQQEQELKCPGCDYQLKYGSSTPYPFGGSDF